MEWPRVPPPVSVEVPNLPCRPDSAIRVPLVLVLVLSLSPACGQTFPAASDGTSYCCGCCSCECVVGFPFLPQHLYKRSGSLVFPSTSDNGPETCSQAGTNSQVHRDGRRRMVQGEI